MSEFMGANLKSSLGVACNKIRYVLHEMMKRTEISIGYYYNFILKVSNALVEGKEIRVEDKLLTYDSFSLKILAPDKLSDLTPGNLKKKNKKLEKHYPQH